MDVSIAILPTRGEPDFTLPSTLVELVKFPIGHWPPLDEERLGFNLSARALVVPPKDMTSDIIVFRRIMVFFFDIIDTQRNSRRAYFDRWDDWLGRCLPLRRKGLPVRRGKIGWRNRSGPCTLKKHVQERLGATSAYRNQLPKH